MGGTVEKVGGGMGGPSAGGAQVVRGPADPLQVGFEGRAEPRTKLGQGGTVRAGEGGLFVRDRRGRGLKNSVGRSGGYGGEDCGTGGVEGLEGGLVVVWM